MRYGGMSRQPNGFNQARGGYNGGYGQGFHGTQGYAGYGSNRPGVGYNRPVQQAYNHVQPAFSTRAPPMDPAFMVARPEVSATAPAAFMVARSRPIAHPQPVSRAMILCNGPQGVMGELTEAKALTGSPASRSTPVVASIYLAGAAVMNRRVSVAAEELWRWTLWRRALGRRRSRIRPSPLLRKRAQHAAQGTLIDNESHATGIR